MRKTLFIICYLGALMLSGATLGVAQPKNQTPSAEDLQKQKKAEQVVIRAMRIFGRTLNFNAVYQNTYVRNRLVQKGEINDLLKEWFDESFYRQISQKDIKKAYIKVNEILWLFSILISNPKTEKYFENFEAKITKRFNRKQRLLYKKLNEGDDNNFIKSRADFQTLLTLGDVAEKYFRDGYTCKIREVLQNKITIDSFEIRETEKEFGNEKPYLSKFKKFYVVSVKANGKWINLSFNVIEEAGIMKIFLIQMTDD